MKTKILIFVLMLLASAGLAQVEYKISDLPQQSTPDDSMMFEISVDTSGTGALASRRIYWRDIADSLVAIDFFRVKRTGGDFFVNHTESQTFAPLSNGEPGNGLFENKQYTIYMNEAANTLHIKARESGGAFITQEIIGSVADFNDGGEAVGAARSLGNTDDFMLSFLSNNAAFLKAKRDTVWQKATPANPSFVNFSNNTLAWQIDNVNNHIKVNVKDANGETFQRTLVDHINFQLFSGVPVNKTISVFQYFKAAAGDLTTATATTESDNSFDFTQTVFEFAADADNWISGRIPMPSDWDGLTHPSFKIVYYVPTGHASTTIYWNLRAGFVRPNADLWVAPMGADGSGLVKAVASVQATANVEYQTIAIAATWEGTPDYRAALKVAIRRYGTHATNDTHASVARVVDIFMSYQKDVIGANF